MSSISDLRKEYTQATLTVEQASNDPLAQFEKWFQEALLAHAIEPNAMNLSTINSDGRPSSRIVLLKGIEGGKFIFFTNYQSDKGKALAHNPACALTFFWPELERQVRIEGIASRIDEQRSIEYFQSRPRASQIGAWASPQSTIIDSRELLENRVKEMEEKFSGLEKLPKPHQWGGFEVSPLMVEFWQGRASRLHDRLQYTLVDNIWKTYRLAP